MKQLKKNLNQLKPNELRDIKFAAEYGKFFNEIPVPIREFIDSPDYLNLKDQCRRRIKEEIVTIFGEEIQPYHLSQYMYALITGGIGIGKTFTGGIVFSYLVYRMGCLKNPQEYYGFAHKTRLAFMNMSHNRNNALDVLFGEVKNRIESSPWFQKNCLPNKKYTNVLKFKNNIYVIPGDSSETTFEGYNIIGGIVDEADSHKITSKKDYAEQGFDTIEIRIKSRANPKFGHIGFLLIIGSKKKQRGFVQRKYDEFKTMDNAHAVHLPMWEARDIEDFKGDYFYFDVLKKEITLPPKGKNPNVLRIPDEYKDDFIRNPDKAMRDLAGHPPFARQPFFALSEKLLNLEFKSPLQNPVERAVGAEVSFHPWFVGGGYKYFVHFDLGLNKDGSDFCGFALGHISDWVKKDNEMKPIVTVDVMLRIEAPPGGEIIIKDLRQIVYYLKEDRGFNIKSVSFDGWQSTETIQQLRKKRIRSDVLSVDKDNKCYDDLKDVIYEDRFVSHYYKPFIEEAIELEHTDAGKIDHPAEGSKDVSDAVAAVVYKLISGKKSSKFIKMCKSPLGESRLGITGEKLYGEFKKQRNLQNEANQI